MDIIETIDTTLSNALTPLNIQEFYGWYDENINQTHVTFLLLGDTDNNYADNKATTTENHIQVDIWSHKNMQDLKKIIKEAMIFNIPNCSYDTGQDFYETDTKLFHKALRFYIYTGCDING